tara:strand:- start:21 stop:764 length:744 start_codon:yes stop_codon:yes gene_type:complete
MATYESKKYATIPIAATQVADGSVTNSEYQFINTLGSNAQTQITNLGTTRLEKSGGTMSGNLTLVDNAHLYVGDGQDLDLYSDGSKIFFKTNDLAMQTSTGENYAVMTANGAVSLYYDNSQKVTTTSSGVSVSGLMASTTASTTGNMTCGGAITATGDITAFSSEALKDDIKTIDNALDKVSNMRGVYYTKDGESGTGVIAEEIEKVLPEVVREGEHKSVAYGNITGILIEAIKDLGDEVKKLKESK